MKGDITRKTLELIEELALFHVDFITGLINAGYRSSQSKLQLEIEKAKKKREEFFANIKNQESFNQMLYRLKKQGIISVGDNRFVTCLTKKGMGKLIILKKFKEKFLPLKNYQEKPDSELKIIIFDIPEKERRKRIWLCATLRDLGFAKHQKSVWIGKFKLPKDFIYDLRALKLLPYVDIFIIKKSGTLIKEN